MQEVINFLFEAGMLAKTPRSGFAFLGAGSQSVAEHSFRMALIGYTLGKLSNKKLDLSKIVLLCLVHDFPETRTGDLNYVNKRYVEVDQNKIKEDLSRDYPFLEELVPLISEYDDNQSLESQIVHDADKIELLLVLKEEMEKGCPQAMDWYKNLENKLTTDEGKMLSQQILAEQSYTWWRK